MAELRPKPVAQITAAAVSLPRVHGSTPVAQITEAATSLPRVHSGGSRMPRRSQSDSNVELSEPVPGARPHIKDMRSLSDFGPDPVGALAAAAPTSSGKRGKAASELPTAGPCDDLIGVIGCNLVTSGPSLTTLVEEHPEEDGDSYLQSGGTRATAAQPQRSRRGFRRATDGAPPAPPKPLRLSDTGTAGGRQKSQGGGGSSHEQKSQGGGAGSLEPTGPSESPRPPGSSKAWVLPPSAKAALPEGLHGAPSLTLPSIGPKAGASLVSSLSGAQDGLPSLSSSNSFSTSSFSFQGSPSGPGGQVEGSLAGSRHPSTTEGGDGKAGKHGSRHSRFASNPGGAAAEVKVTFAVPRKDVSTWAAQDQRHRGQKTSVVGLPAVMQVLRDQGSGSLTAGSRRVSRGVPAAAGSAKTLADQMARIASVSRQIETEVRCLHINRPSVLTA